MGRKDYNRGMEAGARPFENKFRQEQKRNQEWKQTFEEKFDHIKETNEAILDEMDSMQRKQFYKANTAVDIAVLDKGDRETLLSLLFTLAETEENVNKYQRLFVRSVKNYLEKAENGIKTEKWSVLKNGDWSIVETIIGIDETKAIVQAVMEFLFLGYKNHEEYFEEYADLFECFNLNRKGFREIQERIDNIFHAAGAQGLAEMYGYVPEDVSSGTMGSEGLYGVHDEESIGIHGKLAELRVVEEIGLEDGEEKTFENTKIIFEKGIKGVGGHHAKDVKLVFKNCEIIARGEKPEDKKVIISDLEKGEITFESCTVTSEKCALVDCEKMKLVIKDSLLNCGSQIYNDNALWGGGSVSIRHCHIDLRKDRGNKNIFSCGELEMTDTSVCGWDGKDGVDDFHLSHSAQQPLFRSNKHNDEEKRVRIEKCRFHNVSDLLFQGKSEISRSVFENCCIKICDIGWHVYGIFLNCEFQDCIFAESYGQMDFKDSKLLSCMGILPVKRMKDVTLDGGFLVFWGVEDIELVRCKFLNWSEKLYGSVVDKHGKNPFSYSHLTFGRRENEAVIVGSGRGKIAGCQFENMDLGEKYLIGGAHVGHATFEIKNCSFEDIKTGSKGLFRKEFRYKESGLFRDKEVVQTISVITENCIGL